MDALIMRPQIELWDDIFGGLLSRHVFYLSEESVGWLMSLWQEKCGMTRAMRFVASAFRKSDGDILREIESPNDEENIAFYVTLLAWRARLRPGDSFPHIGYSFFYQRNAWEPHRHLVASGLLKVGDAESAGGDRDCEPYVSRGEWMSWFWREEDIAPTDERYRELMNILNVIGPRIRETDLLPSALEFVDFLVERFVGGAVELPIFSISNYALLVYDLGITPDKTLPLFVRLSMEEESRLLFLESFPAWCVGYKMYGDSGLENIKWDDLPFSREELIVFLKNAFV